MAVENLSEFNGVIDRFAGVPRHQVRHVHQGFVVAAAKLAAQLTPVQTGRLRRGWHVEGGVGGDPGPSSRGGLRGSLREVEANAQASVPALREYTVTKVVNEVPYGTAVNNGARGRSGKFMVQRTAQRLRRSTTRRINQLLRESSPL